ncbi:MAG: lytic murein transglycosylase [Acidobacteria bacterium]|nr:lytic murein transglycosylase [Acidobacteriota bacterium]
MLPLIFAVFLAAAPPPNERVEFIVSELTNAGFSRSEAEAFFQDPRLKLYPRHEVQPRKIDWDKVVAQLVEPESVGRGEKFLQEYADVLNRAQQDFGVDKEVLAGILRLESNFGSYTGDYVVFNVFYTTMMNSEEESRWKWFAANLIALAVYCKNTGNDCFDVRGSYGGALGPAQFLPKSAELYGADGDGDGIVDLAKPIDAIYSAANFLVKHGWHQDNAAALGKYFGAGTGYPRAVLAYKEALKKLRTQDSPPPADPESPKTKPDLIIETN